MIVENIPQTLITPDSVAQIIIAGGNARRMGGECKLLLDLQAGKIILDYLCLALEDDLPLFVNCNQVTPQLKAALVPEKTGREISLFPDSPEFAGMGPLAGFHASMVYACAQGYDFIFTLASDTPLIPKGIAQKFIHHYQMLQSKQNLEQQNRKIILSASSFGRAHPIISLMPVSLWVDLEATLRQDLKKIVPFFQTYQWKQLDFSTEAETYDHFFNINHQQNLETARNLADHFHEPE